MKKTLLIIVLTSLFIPLKSSYAIEVTASDGLTFTQSSSSYIFDGDRAGKLNFTSSTNTFSLTDFSEISGFSSSSTSHTFGIADSPTSGYDATINLIPGYGYNTKVDIRDEIGDLVLEDNFDPESENTPFQPLMRIDYDNSNNLIFVSYDSDDSYSNVSILSTGAFSSTVTFTKSTQYSLEATEVAEVAQTPTCAGTGPNCKDLTYWESIEYFGLTPVFTLFPGPNSPVSEPTVFIGIDSFVSFDKG
jgi:hypothetical protein